MEKLVTLIPEFLTTYGKPKIPHDITKYIGGLSFEFSDKSMDNVTDATAFRYPLCPFVSLVFNIRHILDVLHSGYLKK